MPKAQMTRNLIFIVVGIAILVIKPVYSGPGEEAFFAYAGNASVSFALYFLALIAFARQGVGDSWLARGVAAGLVIVVVSAFEITNGFGVMENTYDSWDLLANAVGVGLAVLADAATARFVRPDPDEIDDDEVEE